MRIQIFTKKITENKVTGKEESGLQTHVANLYYLSLNLNTEVKVSGKGKVRIPDAYAFAAANLKIC